MLPTMTESPPGRRIGTREKSKTVLDLPGCQNSTICGISPHGGAQRHPFFAASSSIAVIAMPIAAALSAASRLNQLSRINISIVQASYSTIAQRRPARTRAAWRRCSSRCRLALRLVRRFDFDLLLVLSSIRRHGLPLFILGFSMTHDAL